MKNFKKKKADIELVYKRASGLDLPMQVFLPDGDTKNRQTVLLVHGGGWNDAIQDNSPWNGSWMANNARYFADRGFISVVISYRSLFVPHQLNVGDLLEDCADAVRYMRKHLKFINFDDIVYMGDSAGGYLVTMLGLSQDDEIRPKTVISLNPVLGELDSKWEYGFKTCEDIDSLTPKKIIGEKCADFLLMHGTADKTVEIEFTEELNDLLQNKGHKSQMIKVPGAVHAFALYDYEYSDDFVTNIMEQIISFIKKQN